MPSLENLLPAVLRVGFSGHRQLPQPDRMRDRIEELLDELASTRAGELGAVSSIARGGDLLFVEAALRRRIPWRGLLPFPAADFARDFEPPEWARAEACLARAVAVDITPPTGTPEEAYLDCGIRMVDGCDLLLAVWDGEPPAGPGGTAEVIAYARARERAVIWIHARTGTVTRERLDRLPAPAPGAAHGPVPASVSATGSPPLPRTAGPATEPDDEATGRAVVARAFAACEELARRSGPTSRQLATAIIGLHLLATAVAIGVLAFHLSGPIEPVAAAFKAACLLGALGLAWQHHHHSHAWTEARLAAEVLRSGLAVWSLPEPARLLAPGPLPGIAAWRERLLWLRWRHPPARGNLATWRTDYARDRLDVQTHYFRSRVDGVRRVWKGGRRAALVMTSVALVATLVLIPKTPWDALNHSLKAGSLLLPLASAALLAGLAAHDLGRRNFRYGIMVAFLEGARERVAAAPTAARLCEVVADTEYLLLLEALEWQSVARVTSESH